MNPDLTSEQAYSAMKEVGKITKPTKLQEIAGKYADPGDNVSSIRSKQDLFNFFVKKIDKTSLDRENKKIEVTDIKSDKMTTAVIHGLVNLTPATANLFDVKSIKENPMDNPALMEIAPQAMVAAAASMMQNQIFKKITEKAYLYFQEKSVKNGTAFDINKAIRNSALVGVGASSGSGIGLAFAAKYIMPESGYLETGLWIGTILNTAMKLYEIFTANQLIATTPVATTPVATTPVATSATTEDKFGGFITQRDLQRLQSQKNQLGDFVVMKKQDVGKVAKTSRYIPHYAQ